MTIASIELFDAEVSARIALAFAAISPATIASAMNALATASSSPCTTESPSESREDGTGSPAVGVVGLE